VSEGEGEVEFTQECEKGGGPVIGEWGEDNGESGAGVGALGGSVLC